MQRRWGAGLVFAAGFLWGFCWLMLVAGKIIVDFYRMGFEFETYEPATPNIMALVPPLAIAGGFYLVNLFDVLIAQQRKTRAKREEAYSLAMDEHGEKPL
ncbi:MAG: hypothetical protein ABFR33_02275 [Verrucomicrobiota bacterium]